MNSEFRAALSAAGLDYHGEIIPDGRLHRIKVNGDHNPNSWYVLHGDGLPAGSFGCWKRGISETWCAKSGDTLTEAERAERDRKWKQQQAERDAERRRLKDDARAKAQAILDAGQPATDDHPYLVRKGVQAFPGVKLGAWPQRQQTNCLLVPLRTAAGQLVTVQAIFPAKPATGRDKDFLKGGTTKGAHFVIGDLHSADTVIIAEGYATAATLHAATGYAAVMAIDAGNLKAVAEALRVLYPGKRIIVAADNDRATEGNPGVKAATAAAKAIKATLAIPQFADGEAGTDFNDLAALHGLDAVRDAIDKASQPGKRREQFQVPDDRPSAITGEQRQLIDLALRFQTDLGNSERLIVRHGRDIRYCFDFCKWLVWDGVRWAIDRDGAALDKAKDTARKILAEAATLDDTDDSRKLAAWSFRSQARERMAAMLFLAQSDVSVRPEHLDTHPWLLNVANGTLDLRTGKLRPADRADLMTKAAPVVYDPAATCPEWLAFLARIFDGNAEIIRYVQKAVGYSLTGDDREQAFFVCYGVGRNGKSTLLETLAALLGEDYAQQAAPELLMQKTHDRHPTELAALRGMRLVTAIETGEGRRLNEPLVKQLTGGDRISARFMRGDFFTFTPTHKLWLATNHKPTIRGTDLGMWRRIKLIPFTIQIPDAEKDDGLKARLRATEARPGILNWMLEGVLLWQREGLSPPQAVSAATQAYRDEMDVLAAWLTDCCVIAKQAEASAADLYRSYCQWREQNGERAETQTRFGSRLKEREFEQVRRRNGIFWLGIGLLSREQCEQCEPISRITPFMRDGKNAYMENEFTTIHTLHTPPPTACISTHLGGSEKPVAREQCERFEPCENSAPPGRSTQAHPVATDPKARRIMEQLRAMPAGVTDEELKRVVCTDNGCSPALVDLTLMRLAKAGSLGKVNGRWVLMGNLP